VRLRLARRQLLLSLPAVCLSTTASSAARADESKEAELDLNAADALGHYRILLERVRGDSYEQAAKGTVVQLQTCDDALKELLASVDKLHQRLAQDRSNWPALQDRFAVIERSITLGNL
jgi:hypothetical protein